jgi:uncharacterized membrane protein YfcA
MTEYVIIIIVAFLGSGLTLFSGFGLGTILVPVFALFFPIDLAIVLTAIVHFLNNIFKLILLGKKADIKVVLFFGIPSIIAAAAGAYLLSVISSTGSICEYTLLGKLFFITPLKLVIGVLIFLFTVIDFVPKFKKLEINKKYLPIGGLLSGFFGGLSGNQGALRTMFLVRSNLSKESLIATGVVLACLIDMSRLAIYSNKIINHYDQLNYSLIISATLAAFAGAFFGNRLLKKVTIHFVQNMVGAMLLVFSLLFAIGVI